MKVGDKVKMLENTDKAFEEYYKDFNNKEGVVERLANNGTLVQVAFVDVSSDTYRWFYDTDVELI